MSMVFAGVMVASSEGPMGDIFEWSDQLHRDAETYESIRNCSDVVQKTAARIRARLDHGGVDEQNRTADIARVRTSVYASRIDQNGVPLGPYMFGLRDCRRGTHEVKMVTADSLPELYLEALATLSGLDRCPRDAAVTRLNYLFLSVPNAATVYVTDESLNVMVMDRERTRLASAIKLIDEKLIAVDPRKISPRVALPNFKPKKAPSPARRVLKTSAKRRSKRVARKVSDAS